MPGPRHRLSVLALVAVVLVGLPATPAAAASWRGAVDITFPTVTSARFRDDFANPRGGGRTHRATDLFAYAGAPVRAARGGVVVWLPPTEQAGAGFAIQILGDDGRVYAYYHLGPAGGRLGQAVARNVRLGRRVARGQYLGRVGDSGNAAGGTPHLHFEIIDPRVTDPYGGNRRNPYASLRAAGGRAQGQASPGSVATAPPLLRRGDRGRSVAVWQRHLNRTRRGDELPITGYFGPRTERATVIFQRSAGLGPAGLGIVGPRTRAALAAGLRRPPHTSRSAATGGLLRRGDRGPAVAAWQRRLNRTRRGNELTVDGDFGPRTERATVIFQRSAGLGPRGLGIVGPRTRAALRRALRR